MQRIDTTHTHRLVLLETEVDGYRSFDNDAAYRLTLARRWHKYPELRKQIQDHQERVSKLVFSTATCLGVSERSRSNAVNAARLHDIGKYRRDPKILSKKGRFTDEEFRAIQPHASSSHNIIRNIFQHPNAALLAMIAGQHHEREDGSGYPNNLKGDAITPEAKILAVADIWDALTNDRPYRKALTADEALTIIHKDAGTKFDKLVVDTMTMIVEAAPIRNDRAIYIRPPINLTNH